jgi:hypothetical protein
MALFPDNTQVETARLLAALLLFGYVLIRHHHGGMAFILGISSTSLNSCTGYGYAINIVVSVKTGATEARERIPKLMSTSLRCIPNAVIFSDLTQDIEKYHLIDALDTVSPKTISTNPDFNFYIRQKDLWKSSGDISSLKEIATSKDKSDIAAWMLDKYKFLHILERT